MSGLNLCLTAAEPLNTITIPRNPSIPTRHRWAGSGVVGPGGQRVKLATWKVGGRRVTTPEAVAEFLAQCTGEPPAPTETPADVARRSAEAGRALEALGC